METNPLKVYSAPVIESLSMSETRDDVSIGIGIGVGIGLGS